MEQTYSELRTSIRVQLKRILKNIFSHFRSDFEEIKMRIMLKQINLESLRQNNGFVIIRDFQ